MAGAVAHDADLVAVLQVPVCCLARTLDGFVLSAVAQGDHAAFGELIRSDAGGGRCGSRPG